MLARAATSVVGLIVLLAGCAVAGPPSGSWRSIKSGSWEGYTWTLYGTNPNQDSQCLALDTAPALPGPGIPASDLYQGKAPSCLFRVGFRGRTKYLAVATGFQSESDGPHGVYFAVGLAAPNVRNVRVVLRSGTQVVDTSDHYMAFMYDGNDVLVALEPLDADGRTLRRCPSDIHGVATLVPRC